MNELHIFNEKTYEKYKLIRNVDELSCPLLVSSNENYLNNLNKKILYIGQETNGWLNDYENKEYSINEIENTYYDFIYRGTNDKLFWSFIKNIIGNDNTLINNIIWNNTLIAGKKVGVGCPNSYPELQKLSLEYLLFLYNYFNPEAVILVNGPNNPYYDVTINFLKQINSNINKYPTLDNSLIIDETKNIFWTYHPSYQNRKNMTEKNKQLIKKIITN